MFAEEVTIETLKPEDAKISMNAWPVPNLCVVLMLCVKISQEVTNVNVHQDFQEIPSAVVKNAQVKIPFNEFCYFFNKFCFKLKYFEHFMI